MISHHVKKCSLFFCTLLLLGATPAKSEILKLSDSIQQAKEHNLGLKSASWESHRAAEAVNIKKALNYPRVDAHLGYNMQLEPQAVIISGRVAETQEPDFLFGGINATYTLYDFGKRDAAIEQLKLAYYASNHRYDARVIDVSLQVTDTYFYILESEKLILATKKEVEQLTEHRRVAQALFDEGVVTKNDLLQADVRLAAVSQKKLALENQQNNLWLKLNYLIGKPSNYSAELVEDSSISISDNSELKMESFLSNRGEILALRRNLEQSEAGIKESRSNFYPEIYSKLALDYVQNDKVREQTIMSAVVGIKVNIFDGFASTSSKRQAILLRSQQEDALRQAESEITMEIEIANNDISVAKKQIEVAKTSIASSNENLRINKERYKERIGTATEVLDAQTMLTGAETDYYRAIYGLQRASARYQHAIGKL